MSYCDNYKYSETCDIAFYTEFCDDCTDFLTCNIRYVTCAAGHDIECNNGFQPRNYYDDDYDNDEETIE